MTEYYNHWRIILVGTTVTRDAVTRDVVSAGKKNDNERKITQETAVTMITKDEPETSNGENKHENGNKNDIEENEQKHENGTNEQSNLLTTTNLNSNTHASITTSTSIVTWTWLALFPW